MSLKLKGVIHEMKKIINRTKKFNIGKQQKLFMV